MSDDDNEDSSTYTQQVDEVDPTRQVESEESYDLYEGNMDVGDGIIDNPSIHIYIAHQIMSTETEGDQYVAPASSGTTITTTDETDTTDIDTDATDNDVDTDTDTDTDTTT